ncbi:MAG: hypothetical protein ACI9MC_003901, partial [Kiritimatiellia bacterium]
MYLSIRSATRRVFALAVVGRTGWGRDKLLHLLLLVG